MAGGLNLFATRFESYPPVSSDPAVGPRDSPIAPCTPVRIRVPPPIQQHRDGHRHRALLEISARLSWLIIPCSRRRSISSLRAHHRHRRLGERPDRGARSLTNPRRSSTGRFPIQRGGINRVAAIMTLSGRVKRSPAWTEIHRSLQLRAPRRKPTTGPTRRPNANQNALNRKMSLTLDSDGNPLHAGSNPGAASKSTG